MMTKIPLLCIAFMAGCSSTPMKPCDTAPMTRVNLAVLHGLAGFDGLMVQRTAELADIRKECYVRPPPF